jgi:N-acetylmuramoyl-L-alanine amidase
MAWNGRLRIALALAALLGAAGPPAGAGPSEPPPAQPSDHPPALRAATVAQAEGETRVDLLFDAPLAAPGAPFALTDPPRILLVLPQARWAAAPPAPAGLVAGLRFGLAAPGLSRLALDLAAPARVAGLALTAEGEGTRLTLRLAAEDAARFAARAGWPPGAARHEPGPAGAPPPPARRIVLDPGHGGADPGAVRMGLREKDVTLAFAHQLAPRLAARGWAVSLTREDDRFVALADRVALAQALRADAFLSIHADTVLQGDASGASVYVLSAEASDAEAAALAERENRADRLGGLDLPAADEDVARALIALVRGPTMARAQALGAALVAGLSRRVAVLPSAPLRGAGFRVLKAPDVPSALLELGFLSNAADRTRLADPAWRAEAAEAVAEALEAWAEAGREPGG